MGTKNIFFFLLFALSSVLFELGTALFPSRSVSVDLSNALRSVDKFSQNFAQFKMPLTGTEALELKLAPKANKVAKKSFKEGFNSTKTKIKEKEFFIESTDFSSMSILKEKKQKLKKQKLLVSRFNNREFIEHYGFSTEELRVEKGITPPKVEIKEVPRKTMAKKNFRKPAFPTETLPVLEGEIKEKDFFVESVSFTQSSLLKEKEQNLKLKKENIKAKELSNKGLVEHHGFFIKKPNIKIKMIPPGVKIKRSVNSGKPSIVAKNIPAIKIRTKEKEFFVESTFFAKSFSFKGKEKLKKRKIKIDKVNELNNKELIEHYGFSVQVPKISMWNEYFQKLNFKKELAKWDKKERDRLKEQELKSISALNNLQKVNVPDTQKIFTQNLVKDFKNDEQSLEKVLAEVEKKSQVNSHEDKPTFYQYVESNALDTKPESNQENKTDESKYFASDQTKEKLQKQSVKLTQASQSKESLNSIRMVSQSSISPVVQKAIEREMGKTIKSSPKIVRAIPQRNDYSYSDNQKNDLSAKNLNWDWSLTKIKVFEMNLNNKENNKVFQFQFIPDYDKNESINDDQDGNIILKNKFNDSQSLIRGTLVKHGLMRTKVEIPLGLEKMNFAIPMITQESMERFINENEIEGHGGFLLVDLGEHLDDVDIDQEYQSRVFIDENFKIADLQRNYRYVLYSGVKAGNIVIRYLLTNGRIAQKISHIVSDEILFEMGHISFPALEKLSLVERHALGSTTSELDVSQKNISIFNTDIKLTKEGLNRFEAEFPSRPLGMRHFIELTHLEGSLFVGFGQGGKLEVPSQDFIANILKVHDLDELNGQCVVQINLDKKIKNVIADGDTNNGAMSFRKTFLEKDGLFTEEPSEMSQKAFLIGEMPGVFNIKIEYQNGAANYLQSFCSESTYLVESL